MNEQALLSLREDGKLLAICIWEALDHMKLAYTESDHTNVPKATWRVLIIQEGHTVVKWRQPRNGKITTADSA